MSTTRYTTILARYMTIVAIVWVNSHAAFAQGELSPEVLRSLHHDYSQAHRSAHQLVQDNGGLVTHPVALTFAARHLDAATDYDEMLVRLQTMLRAMAAQAHANGIPSGDQVSTIEILVFDDPLLSSNELADGVMDVHGVQLSSFSHAPRSFPIATRSDRHFDEVMHRFWGPQAHRLNAFFTSLATGERDPLGPSTQLLYVVVPTSADRHMARHEGLHGYQQLYRLQTSPTPFQTWRAMRRVEVDIDGGRKRVSLLRLLSEIEVHSQILSAATNNGAGLAAMIADVDLLCRYIIDLIFLFGEYSLDDLKALYSNFDAAARAQVNTIIDRVPIEGFKRWVGGIGSTIIGKQMSRMPAVAALNLQVRRRGVITRLADRLDLHPVWGVRRGVSVEFMSHVWTAEAPDTGSDREIARFEPRTIYELEGFLQARLGSSADEERRVAAVLVERESRVYLVLDASAQTSETMSHALLGGETVFGAFDFVRHPTGGIVAMSGENAFHPSGAQDQHIRAVLDNIGAQGIDVLREASADVSSAVGTPLGIAADRSSAETTRQNLAIVIAFEQAVTELGGHGELLAGLREYIETMATTVVGASALLEGGVVDEIDGLDRRLVAALDSLASQRHAIKRIRAAMDLQVVTRILAEQVGTVSLAGPENRVQILFAIRSLATRTNSQTAGQSIVQVVERNSSVFAKLRAGQ